MKVVMCWCQLVSWEGVSRLLQGLMHDESPVLPSLMLISQTSLHEAVHG